MNDAAKRLCEELDLSPHPEGGWYRETWRADAPDGGRAAGTAIHFLLAAGDRSHWHRVDAAELWFWHCGDPLALHIADTPDGGDPPWRTVRLGGDVTGGEAPQALVPPDHWQAAEPVDGAAGYTLVSCAVVPGFDFAGFTLAPPDWTPAIR
ncbi:MAG: cupin domain-containing protein [Pseudomonadota bacterium]